jgi:Ser/Thr protein kinase RdoA (MazF antagonist)
MAVHDLSADGDVLKRVGRIARQAVGRYGWPDSTAVELLNLSENATYLVEHPSRPKAVLRVHRLDYHARDEVESELTWMAALREDTGIRTPRVLTAPDGCRVVVVADEASVEERYCVMFEHLPGREPDEAGSFERLGEITARMHRHARGWVRPRGFRRFSWDCDAAFGHEARWGRWQHAPGVGAVELQVLGRLEETLRGRLAAFGTGHERFGLVHADTRLANLLVDDDSGAISVIDFDDCGFSWYLYDLATAFTFFEHRPHVPELIEAWLRGYRTVLELPPEDEAEIWTLILFRRLLLVAWIGSHGAVEVAKQLGAGYAKESCELAERYMSGLL